MKAITTLFATFAMLVLFAGSAYADTGYVVGQIYDKDYNGVDGAYVVVSCADGSGSEGTYTTPAGSNGVYRIYMVCTGNQVDVTATKGDLIGYGHGTFFAAINIAVANVVLTPEFGLIAIPLLLSMAGFVFMKGRMI